MPELTIYESQWRVISDIGEFTINDKQMDKIVEAEAKGVKIVRFDNQVINLSYFKGAYRIRQEKPKAVWDDKLGKPVEVA